MAFVCYVLLKEASIHVNLYHVCVEKVFCLYQDLLLGLSSIFSQNSRAFLKKFLYLLYFSKLKLIKNILFN